ncbi:hypothetical protein Plhal304r1_c018g0063481 [Plasmopara halstedii]
MDKTLHIKMNINTTNELVYAHHQTRKTVQFAIRVDYGPLEPNFLVEVRVCPSEKGLCLHPICIYCGSRFPHYLTFTSSFDDYSPLSVVFCPDTTENGSCEISIVCGALAQVVCPAEPHCRAHLRKRHWHKIPWLLFLSALFAFLFSSPKRDFVSAKDTLKAYVYHGPLLKF